MFAIIAGAALAVSGAITQGLTRNPLAAPDILGVNVGASFAMVLAITLNGQGSIGFAFAGAAVRSEERRVGKECRSRWSPYH